MYVWCQWFAGTLASGQPSGWKQELVGERVEEEAVLTDSLRVWIGIGVVVLTFKLLVLLLLLLLRFLGRLLVRFLLCRLPIASLSKVLSAVVLSGAVDEIE